MNPTACTLLAFFLTVSQAVAVAAKSKTSKKPSKSKSKISLGVIIVIVVLVVILLVLAGVAFFVFRCLRRRRKSNFPLKTQEMPMFSGGQPADPEQVSFLHPPPPPPLPPQDSTFLPAQPQVPYDQASWRPESPQPQFNNGPSFPAPYPPTHP